MGSNHQIVEEILSFCVNTDSSLLEKIAFFKEELNNGFNLFSKTLEEYDYNSNYALFCKEESNQIHLKIELEELDVETTLKIMDKLVSDWYENCPDDFKDCFNFELEC